MPYSSSEKKREHNQRYYYANRETILANLRAKYRTPEGKERIRRNKQRYGSKPWVRSLRTERSRVYRQKLMKKYRTDSADEALQRHSYIVAIRRRFETDLR